MKTMFSQLPYMPLPTRNPNVPTATEGAFKTLAEAAGDLGSYIERRQEETRKENRGYRTKAAADAQVLRDQAVELRAKAAELKRSGDPSWESYMQHADELEKRADSIVADAPVAPGMFDSLEASFGGRAAQKKQAAPKATTKFEDITHDVEGAVQAWRMNKPSTPAAPAGQGALPSIAARPDAGAGTPSAPVQTNPVQAAPEPAAQAGAPVAGVPQAAPPLTDEMRWGGMIDRIVTSYGHTQGATDEDIKRASAAAQEYFNLPGQSGSYKERAAEALTMAQASLKAKTASYAGANYDLRVDSMEEGRRRYDDNMKFRVISLVNGEVARNANLGKWAPVITAKREYLRLARDFADYQAADSNQKTAKAGHIIDSLRQMYKGTGAMSRDDADRWMQLTPAFGSQLEVWANLKAAGTIPPDFERAITSVLGRFDENLSKDFAGFQRIAQSIADTQARAWPGYERLIRDQAASAVNQIITGVDLNPGSGGELAPIPDVGGETLPVTDSVPKIVPPTPEEENAAVH